MSTSKLQNIVILNHHASSPEIGGGGRHYEIGKYLSEKGYKITIIASSYDNSKKKYTTKEKIHEELFNPNFKFVKIRTKPAYKSMIGRFVNYIDYMVKASQFKKFNNDPHVVIASSVHPLAWISGYRISQRYNAKFIVEVRDLWPLTMYEDLSSIKRKLIFTFFEFLERKYYSLADSIITTAPYAYEYMSKKYKIDRNKVYHIPHGIDIKWFDSLMNTSESILPKLLAGTLKNHFCVTYTGSLSKSEGLGSFVESAKFLREYHDIKLIVIGSGPEKSLLFKIIKDNNLDNVIIIEKQPKKYIPIILNQSKILFCGLIDRKVFKYGISKNKFYDYMAASKPIVFASNVRDSLISKANAGVTIEPNNPRKIAETIIWFYNNYDTIGKKCGRNGRLYVEQNHLIEVIAKKVLQVILRN